MTKGYRAAIISANDDIRKTIRFALKNNYFLYEIQDCTILNISAKANLAHVHIIYDDPYYLDSIEICTVLKGKSYFQHTRILLLTSNEDESFHVAALQAGADDILSLPLSSNVLLSKVSMLLRREKNNARQDLVYKELIISPEKYSVTIIGRGEYDLPKKEFELLYLLAEAPGKVFSRAEIMDSIWDAGVVVGDRTVDVHIRKIRKTLDLHCIHTVNGLGYKFMLSPKIAG